MTDAAVGARSGDAELLILADEAIGDGGDEARAGGAEGVADRERAAHGVELLKVDRAHLGLAAEILIEEFLRVERVDVGEDLAGEGFVELDDTKVGQLHLRHVENLRPKAARRTQASVWRGVRLAHKGG